MSRLDRLEQEQERARQKILEQQERLKNLTAQVTEAENTEIVAAIRSLRLTREELREFIKNGTLPSGMPGAEAVPEARYAKPRPAKKETEAQGVTPTAGTSPQAATAAGTKDSDSQGGRL